MVKTNINEKGGGVKNWEFWTNKSLNGAFVLNVQRESRYFILVVILSPLSYELQHLTYNQS